MDDIINLADPTGAANRASLSMLTLIHRGSASINFPASINLIIFVEMERKTMRATNVNKRDFLFRH